MSKTVNGETKKFGYDGEDLILEMNDKDSITADYTHGPGIDNPLMMNRAGKNYYYAKDGLGSMTALTDSTGNVVHEYKYSVFGKVTEEAGESIENPFTYTSRESDKETGLMYYRARYYDPGMGRFLSEDPIGLAGGDANFYRYVRNNPVNLIDPLGLTDLNLFEYGDENRQSASQIWGPWNTYTIMAHASKMAVGDENGNRLSPAELADRIRDDPNFKSWMTVNLFACNVGISPEGGEAFAQLLANKLGVDVLAPNDLAWLDPSGGNIERFGPSRFDYGLGKDVFDKETGLKRYSPSRQNKEGKPCQ